MTKIYKVKCIANYNLRNTITEKNGKVIKSKDDLNKDDEISLRFFDGEKQAKII